MKRQPSDWWPLVALAVVACGMPDQVGSAQESSFSEQKSGVVCGPDTTPPVSTISVMATPDAFGVYHDMVRVELRAEDDCSGIRGVSYSLSGASSGGEFQFGSYAQFWITNLGTTTITYYANDGERNYEEPHHLDITIAGACSQIQLNDFTVYVSGNYSGGHSLGGKVAAGGTLSLQDFSAGAEVPANAIDNVLVAGQQLNLTRGGVFGNAYYGSSTTADQTVSFSRGALAQGNPINFVLKSDALRTLSLDLHNNLPANGATRLEPWGGVFLEGTDPQLNVFNVDASAFSNAVYRSISAPAGSVAVVNIIGPIGSTFTLANSGTSLSGVDQRGVLYHFWGATTININNFILQGTVLAPWADVTFTTGSLEGAIYAQSMVGGAETHVYPLRSFAFCGASTY